MKTRTQVTATLYPEFHAGHFTRDDQIPMFFGRVHALLEENMRVLDFGAGRGAFADSYRDHRYKLDLVTLKGRCKEVVGCDIDDSVRLNRLLDTPVVINPDEPLPFDDSSFDMVISWAVFEHIEDPTFYAAELGRLLKPGGWLCAWTPNKYAYFAVAARIIPAKLHRHIVSRLLRDPREDRDIFPTYYRMNTKRTLRRLFPSPHFEHYSYGFSGTPGYHGNRLFIARAIKFYTALVPECLSAFLHVFIRKTPVAVKPSRQ